MRHHWLLGVVVVVAGLIAGGKAGDADESPAFADWARALYLGELALRDSGVALSDQELQALFTPEVQTLRERTRDRVPPPDEPTGPILDLLLGWGAPPNRKVELVSITREDADQATVALAIDGNPTQLKLKGVFDPLQQTWRIEDIDYGGGGPDRTLRGRLERMTGWQPK
jgi:hypothetical protein